jgi:uncharacterized membrane protein (UPF0136 family)
VRTLRLRTRGRTSVGAIEALTAVAGCVGGIGLIVNGLGMRQEDAPALLGGTWRVPGLALLVCVGAGQALAAAAELSDDRRAGGVTLAAGAAMVCLEVAELRLIPFSWLTPAFLAVGLAEMASSVERR